jgi:putative zinc finger/helix-turn-helix YgiT family protein
MEKTINICPKCNGRMMLRQIHKTISFKGEKLDIQFEEYVCENCQLHVGTVEQTAVIQNLIADAYRKKVGLLTGQELREKREELGISQKELAKRACVGIASIKRWEKGIIQTKSMNAALMLAFQNGIVGNDYTGNSTLSIPRIKSVMKEFEGILGFEFLQEEDIMLFDAKYVFYADFSAHQLLGKSLTGTTYAALSHGPQINNYRELIDEIRNANIEDAEPLTDEEKKIIVRVALTFPTKQSVIDAAHREEIFKNKRKGELIPYTDASELTEIQLDP